MASAPSYIELIEEKDLEKKIEKRPYLNNFQIGILIFIITFIIFGLLLFLSDLITKKILVKKMNGFYL